MLEFVGVGLELGEGGVGGHVWVWSRSRERSSERSGGEVIMLKAIKKIAPRTVAPAYEL